MTAQSTTAILADLDMWSFPPEPWEVALVEEVLALPELEVPFLRQDLIELLGLRAAYCHDNVDACLRFGFPGNARAVLGWTDVDGRLAVHAVLGMGDDLVNVTPYAGGYTSMMFRPDPLLIARREGDKVVVERNAQSLGVGVRVDPVATLAQIAATRELIGLSRHG